MKSNESNQGDANKIATQSDTIIPVGRVLYFSTAQKAASFIQQIPHLKKPILGNERRTPFSWFILFLYNLIYQSTSTICNVYTNSLKVVLTDRTSYLFKIQFPKLLQNERH